MSPPTLCYIGWHNQGNLGDDAIREAVQSALHGAEIVDLAMQPRVIATSLASGLHRRVQDSTLVLGGGTCLGRRNWRRVVRLGTALTRGRPGYAIGAGVEDPAFVGLRSYSDRDELARWPRLLGSFRSVSVRGPRSAALLADVGVDAPVVGDPALLLPRVDVEAVEGRIGVNLGFGDDLWGHDGAGVADVMASVCAELDAAGHELVGIPMNEDDRTWLATAFRDVTRPVEIVEARTTPQVIAALASCSVAIVSRLHAAVLAALAGTPTVTLEYQPKCRDFALSIGNGDFLVRTDRVSTGTLLERTETALAERNAISNRTTDAVDHLRGCLTSAYGAARQDLGLGAD